MVASGRLNLPLSPTVAVDVETVLDYKRGPERERGPIGGKENGNGSALRKTCSPGLARCRRAARARRSRLRQVLRPAARSQRRRGHEARRTADADQAG